MRSVSGASFAGSYDGAAGGISNNFNIASLIVREEADINKIADALYRMQRRNARGMGVTFV
jgi:predicted N-acetyltransferase YhbS